MSKRKCRHETRSAPPCRERRRSAPSVLSACRRGVHIGVASADARATSSLRRVDRSGGAVRCRLLQSARDVDPVSIRALRGPRSSPTGRRAVPALRPRDHSDGDRSGPHGPHNRPDLVHPLPRRTGSASGLTTRARRSAILRVGRLTALRLSPARTHHLCEHLRTVSRRGRVDEIGRRPSMPMARRVRTASRPDSGKKGEPEAP